MAAFAKTLQKSNAGVLTDVEVLASPDKVAASLITHATGFTDAAPTIGGDTEEPPSSSEANLGGEAIHEPHHRLTDEL